MTQAPAGGHCASQESWAGQQSSPEQPAACRWSRGHWVSQQHQPGSTAISEGARGNQAPRSAGIPLSPHRAELGKSHPCSGTSVLLVGPLFALVLLSRSTQGTQPGQGVFVQDPGCLCGWYRINGRVHVVALAGNS